MRVILLKPGGVAFLAAGMLILGGLAFAGSRHSPMAVPAKDAAPAGVTVIGAESFGAGTLRPDSAARGGKYVHAGGDYQPLAFASVPPGAAGDSLTVWAHARQTSVQLKGTRADGKQNEYEWNYETPATFRWVRLGRHTRAALGNKVVLIRARDNKNDKDGLDAVLFADDDRLDPNRTTPE